MVIGIYLKAANDILYELSPMKTTKRIHLSMAIALAAAAPNFASADTDASGFIEDSSLTVLSRALYFNRDFRNGSGNISDASRASGFKNGYAEETGLGIRALYESGFTQGTVGFGLDAHLLTSIVLDSGKGRYGTGQFDRDSDGRAEKTQSEAGGAIKFKVSETVLKHGNMIVASPVFATDDARILPEVATGTFVTSNEIDKLTLSAGKFSALSSSTSSNRDDGELTTLTMLGGTYDFTDALSASYYDSRLDDHFTKRYVNLNYVTGALSYDFNAYRTEDIGKKLSDEIDNTIWSLSATYDTGAHSFTVAHQRSSGKTGYVYGIDGGGTVYLANSVQLKDFDMADERSWQVRYDLDMAPFGVPGLSFMGRYVLGTNIDLGPDMADGKRWERNLEAKYVMQEGVVKDLTFRIRQATYRSSDSVAMQTPDLDEVRVIVEYPLSIL